MLSLSSFLHGGLFGVAEGGWVSLVSLSKIFMPFSQVGKLFGGVSQIFINVV